LWLISNTSSLQAYILTTYLVPPSPSPGSPSHKLLNIATLVGPSSLASPALPAGEPYVVWSTTKHHPVPFVESYSHSSRNDLVLGSSPNALPLSTVKLQPESHVPSPKLTPLQSISVGGAICQDVAFPSLLSSFIVPSSSSSPASSLSRTPHLLLNPSLTPLCSFASPQLAQSRARAVEAGAFLLRCDGAAGTSALVGPDGEVLSLVKGEDGGGSWSAEIAVERASGATLFQRLAGGGRSKIGAEGASLLWLALLFGAISFVDAGGVQHTARRIEWKKLGRKAVEGAKWVRWTVERMVGRVSEEGMGRSGVIERDEEERLVDVE
jgi:uncharacterized protein GlcG (DUF336 family)